MPDTNEQQKQSTAGLFGLSIGKQIAAILISCALFLVSAFFFLTANSVSKVAEESASKELLDLGYGMTAIWFESNPSAEDGSDEAKIESAQLPTRESYFALERLAGVSSVDLQQYIDCPFSIGQKESSTLAEIFPFSAEEFPYKAFDESMHDSYLIEAIADDSVYVSPKLRDSLGAKVGDVVELRLIENTAPFQLTIAGFIEDALHGTLSDDKATFLVSYETFNQMGSIIANRMEAIPEASQGVLVHVRKVQSDPITAESLMRDIDQGVEGLEGVSQYVKESRSFDEAIGNVAGAAHDRAILFYAICVLALVGACIACAVGVSRASKSSSDLLEACRNAECGNGAMFAIFVMPYVLFAVIGAAIGLVAAFIVAPEIAYSLAGLAGILVHIEPSAAMAIVALLICVAASILSAGIPAHKVRS